MKALVYLSTKDLCTRFRCSSRTVFRRMQRGVNPFPLPAIVHAGSFNLWDVQEVEQWERRERERTDATRAAVPMWPATGRAA